MHPPEPDHPEPSASPGPVLVEICVDDLAGALAAEQSGAHRIELCADLVEGGTTPSLGLLRAVLAQTSTIGVQVMVRPRGGDFVYSAAELDVMCADAREIAAVAASVAPGRVGIVTGALTAAGTIDVAAIERLSDASGETPLTFHKAFDATVDLLASYDTLAQLGVERILTSGGAPTAEQGAPLLAELVARSTPSGPSILVGGGVRPRNVQAILAATGATEVHLRAQVASVRGDGTLQTDGGIIQSVLGAVADATATTTTTAAGASGASARERGSVVLALDIGGTNLKGAVVDSRGRVVRSQTIDAGASGADSLERVRSLLTGLQREAAGAGYDVIGAGVVTPGIIDPANGVVLYASTLEWSNVALGEVLAGDLGVPVAIGHDVRSAGLAESLFGASAEASNSVLVAIGTGVAASILSSEVPVTGALTSAGELGHIPVFADGEDCTCGQHGCLEVYMSGAGLARRYLAQGGGTALTAEQIVDRVATDRTANLVWHDGIEALALGLKTTTLLFDPAVIVLTGGVSRAGDALLEPLREQLSASLAWRAAPPVQTSVLGTSGGRIGASVLAYRAAGRDDIPVAWNVDDLLENHG